MDEHDLAEQEHQNQQAEEVYRAMAEQRVICGGCDQGWIVGKQDRRCPHPDIPQPTKSTLRGWIDTQTETWLKDRLGPNNTFNRAFTEDYSRFVLSLFLSWLKEHGKIILTMSGHVFMLPEKDWKELISEIGAQT